MTEETGPAEEAAAMKFDNGKASLEMFPPSYWKDVKSHFSLSMSRWFFYNEDFPKHLPYDPMPVLEHGKSKYGQNNWVSGMRWGRFVGAFHRHCNYFDEESQLWIPRNLNDIDPLSQMPHGQHAECNRMFLGEFWYRHQVDGVLIGEIDCAWNNK